MKTFPTAAVALSMAIIVTGCGGGGGGSTTAPTSTGTGTGTGTVTNTCSNGATNYPSCNSNQWEAPVTSVPPPTYASGSANLTMFNMVNKLRSGAGAGLLAQNADMDTAALGYVNYIITNENTAGFIFDDSEISGWPGFTGIEPNDRIAAAGYVGVGTGVAYGGSPNPVVCINELMGTVYHRLNLINGWVNIGLGFGIDSQGYGHCVANTASPATFGQGDENPWLTQIPVAPVVYPYAGQKTVGTSFYGEIPNPAPDLLNNQNNSIGTPITVSLADQALVGANLTGFSASSVTITAFTLTQQGSATPLPARIVTAAGVKGGPGVTLTSEVNTGYTSQYQDYLLPLSPLLPNTTYNAVFTATVNGQNVNLSWSFTTGTPQPDGTII